VPGGASSSGIRKGYRGRKSYSGTQGQSPGREPEGKVPQKLKQFADIVYRL